MIMAFGGIAILVLLFATLLIYWVILVKSTHTLRKELSLMTERVNAYLEQTARLSQQTGEGTMKAMSDVYSRLGALEESSTKIFEVGKEIGKLQEVLRAPKARGGFGEWMLADILSQMIPRDHFQLQYQFRNGTRVDAAIFVGDHLVPIDAKFPLENFQRFISDATPEEKRRWRKDFARDVKRHIEAISERYILPEEGTFDFALMYIPAENVYYEVIAADPDIEESALSAYALDHYVVPVSPNSFYAYLQVILIGLRGLKVDQAAREITESLKKMQGDFRRIAADFETLGTHLNHAKGSHERVQRGLDQFGGKLAVVDQMSPIGSQSPESLQVAK